MRIVNPHVFVEMEFSKKKELLNKKHMGGGSLLSISRKLVNFDKSNNGTKHDIFNDVYSIHMEHRTLKSAFKIEIQMIIHNYKCLTCVGID